ncbi:unnamed protein product [Moneuplotes crassus]|uniref:Tubulin-tyrosine ligase family protein n=1 Tax=Euplotes crassus TaxID=5936 RepID=A0AAD1UAP1_EUPCR|nr:unnamed protein product [Moneuplotes crassus]
MESTPSLEETKQIPNPPQKSCECKPIKKKFKCVIYDAEARYDKNLVKCVCERFKNFKYSNNIRVANLMWFGKHLYESDVELCGKIKGFVNKVPGAGVFNEKQTQGRVLSQLAKVFPEEFAFHPRSFCLPKDTDDLEEAIKANPKKLLIAKPNEGGGGGGIFLFKSMKDLSGFTWASECVVQRYIANPLLINNRKWDMRVYVMIHGINPMKAYLATDYGLARFCTEDYDTSDPNNILSHLTNYSLNKNSEGYVKDQDLDENSEENNTKISLDLVWKLIQKQYPDVDIETDCKQKMRDIVINVLSGMRSTIELGYLEMTKLKSVEHNKKFYQILGFDIMFDDEFNGWLFEVNSYPSMDIFYHKDKSDGTYDKEKSEIDERVKSTIFAEAARILIAKDESDVFEQVYDSQEQEGLYEDVFEIYKKLSGIRLGQSISSSKFSKLSKYLPKSLSMSQVDLEILFTKLKHSETTSIGLMGFFEGLSMISSSNSIDLSDLTSQIISNFD